jgi:ABC-type bacteriocin/lantibiotic exporter with double-glycine peptidase domain
MIKSIYALLNLKEKKIFYFLFVLVILNAVLELISLATFYPLLRILLDEHYNLNFINIYLDKLNLKIADINNKLILIVLFLVFITFIIKNFFYLVYVYFQNNFIKNTRLRISYDLVNKYITLPYSYFFKKNLSTIYRNVALSTNFSSIVYALLTFYLEILVFLFLILFLLTIEFKLTSIIIIILTALILVYKQYSKDEFFKLGIISQKYAEKLNHIILQMFSGIREVKVLKKESFFMKNFSRVNNLEAYNNFKRDFLLQIPKIIIELTVILLLVFLIFYMFIFEYEKSEILVYISLMIIASGRLMPSAIRIISSIQRLKYYQPLNHILIQELKSKIEKDQEKKLIKNSLTFNKHIIFKNVSFYYSKNKYIFKNFNLKIKKNTCIGIFGSSGSGKSTFLDLLIGLLKPTSGFIKVDNFLLDNNLEAWRTKVSYVSQSKFFLNETIEKNIAFGVSKMAINQKLLIKVSKDAQIYDDIRNMKLKFKTNMGENGLNLSGGQLQRIAIARALYHQSELIIFDEATNALDRENEESIFKILNNLKKKYTIIVISHSKYNFKICDKVYNLNNI